MVTRPLMSFYNVFYESLSLCPIFKIQLLIVIFVFFYFLIRLLGESLVLESSQYVTLLWFLLNFRENVGIKTDRFRSVQTPLNAHNSKANFLKRHELQKS